MSAGAVRKQRRTGSTLRAAPADWLAASARRRRRRQRVRVVAHHHPSTTGPASTDVAVAIITHGRAESLLATLDRLRQLPERPRVLVVDNASRDGTAEAVRHHAPWAELLVLDSNAGAVGRNVAVDHLDVPYVAFADDDTWWAPGSLDRAVQAFEGHPDVAIVTARIVVEPGGHADPIVDDMRDSPLPDDDDVPGLPLLSFLAGASVVRRSAFAQVGGFEPRLWLGGEEELLAVDLAAGGWLLRYLPEAQVHHRVSPIRGDHARRSVGLRNTLWFTWLRRPLPRACWRTAATLRTAPADLVTVRALVAAARGIPWVLRERRPLPREIEAGLRLLDEQQLHSRARRYVS